MKIKPLILILLGSFTFYGVEAQALAELVWDPEEIAKTVELIKTASQQLESLKDLAKSNGKQYQFLQEALRGNFGYGQLFNDQNAIKKRQWANDKWIDVLNKSNTGESSAFAQAQKAYEALYPIADANLVGQGHKDGGLDRAFYKQSSSISRAALAASSTSYDQVNQHIRNLHEMLNKLDAQPNEKAAIDLNARLVAELGFIELELLRQQTIQNQLSATQAQGNVNGMSKQATFLQWNNQ